MTALKFRLDASGGLVAGSCQQPVQTAAHGRQVIISAIIFAFLLGAFIFVVLPRARLARRTLSVGIFFLLIGVVYGGSVELSAVPSPSARMARHGGGPGGERRADRERGDLVWLTMPGSPEPCAYVLPWSIEAAQQLQNAMSQADSEGRGSMGIPFEASLDDRKLMFYAMPQPAMPAKDYPDSTPLIHLQPDEAS